MQLTLHSVLKLLLSAVLGSVGALCLLHAAGVMQLPDALRLSHVDHLDKWTRGAALLALPPRLFVAILGLCKTAAALGFWVGGDVDRLVTLLAALMYLCVGVAHHQMDGAIAGPLGLAALCIAKLLTTPPVVGPVTKTKL